MAVFDVMDVPSLAGPRQQSGEHSAEIPQPFPRAPVSGAGLQDGKAHGRARIGCGMAGCGATDGQRPLERGPRPSKALRRREKPSIDHPFQYEKRQLQTRKDQAIE
jgi:hypothetical protein